MITFLWPWIFLLLPLPLLARRLLPPALPRRGALRLPFYSSLVRDGAGRPGRGGWRGIWLPLLIWLMLVTAIAQPLWVRDDQPLPTSGRDLMLLIDVSGSMRKMDFVLEEAPADRLTVVKEIASRFVRGRHGDRVGLILFGDKPYLRASLTHDREAIVELIGEAEIALAGESTAMGDAVGLAIKRLRELESQSRVVVVLTDGANNEGRITPRQASELARLENVRIYTIGVGAPEAAAPNPYGIWSTEGAGRYEREVLEQMAESTQGGFFHALDAGGLQAAYDRLDRLEPALGEDVYKYFATPLYPWPLVVGLLLSLWLAVRQRGWSKGRDGEAG